MPLLIDYSKRRAEINSSSSNINIDVSFHGCDDLGNSWDTYGNEEGKDHCRRHRPLGKTKHLDYSNGSHDTETTADTSSSSSVDDSLTEATPCTVSFRIKRRSSTGLGCFLQEAEEKPMESRRILRPKRFSEPIGKNLQNTKKTVETPASRRRTLPDRVQSGDSIKARLQLDSWKKKQQSLLSAPAKLATVSDRDLLQQPGRRGSIPKDLSGEANHHQQQQAPPSRIVCPNKRSSETENTRPGVPVKSISMNITRTPTTKHSASFQSRRPTKTHSFYYRPNNNISSPSSQMLTLMNLSRALPIGQQQQRRCPEPTKSSSRQRRLRSNSFRTSSGLVRRGSIENLRTSSHRSLTRAGPGSHRRSVSEASTNSSVNLNDFVTGSRIRRLDAHPGN